MFRGEGENISRNDKVALSGEDHNAKWTVDVETSREDNAWLLDTSHLFGIPNLQPISDNEAHMDACTVIAAGVPERDALKGNKEGWLITLHRLSD